MVVRGRPPLGHKKRRPSGIRRRRERSHNLPTRRHLCRPGVTIDEEVSTGEPRLPRVGFTGAGLQEIIDEGDLVNGDFYCHFASKESFALEVIDRYTAKFGTIAARHLGNAATTPLARLHSYFGELITTNGETSWSEGCLLATLGQEVSGRNDALRTKIDLAFHRWRSALTDCLLEGQKVGEIRKDIPAETLADVCLNAWEGALLRMRLARSRDPLDRFVEPILGRMLLTTPA